MIKIDFADRPSVVNRHKGKELASKSRSVIERVCHLSSPSQAKFKGTSLIFTMEFILQLIEQRRKEGDERRILVSITLHEAESGPEQPLMDQAGYQYLRNILDKIEEKKGVVRIIGPTEDLHRQIIKNLGLKVYCPANSLTNCIQEAFGTIRY